MTMHVACMGEMRKASKISVVIRESKKQLGRQRVDEKIIIEWILKI